MKEMNGLEALIKQFDSFGYYLGRKLDADIEENRKGQFALKFTDPEGNILKNVHAEVRQLRHEFRFGCSLFHLEQFRDSRDAAYKNRFANLFNYGTVPLYWDTLEPEEGKPRFEKDSAFISRRPPLDTIAEFCGQNSIRTKGHCLVYNSFQPDWISDNNRELKIQIENRVKAIAERYGNFFEDLDVINEMLTIYKNCYKGNGARNLQITDDRDYERFCFELCRRCFPNSRLFWNEGNRETFGDYYHGYRSFYYMTIEKMLSQGIPVQGIGMQFHQYAEKETVGVTQKEECNPLRLIDAFDCYGEFGLPIHISETSIPSYTNDADDEVLQAELTKRLYKLWFGRKHCDAIVWWNLADNTAYQTENKWHSGLLRGDCSEKPAYTELEKLINREWHTELSAVADGRLNFRGFYGEYEIKAECDGRSTVKTVRLSKDNTGFDNRLCDFRETEIVI